MVPSIFSEEENLCSRDPNLLQGVNLRGTGVPKVRDCCFFRTGQSILKRGNPRSSSGPCAVVRALDVEGRSHKGKCSLGGAKCDMETQEVSTVFPGAACGTRKTPLPLMN